MQIATDSKRLHDPTSAPRFGRGFMVQGASRRPLNTTMPDQYSAKGGRESLWIRKGQRGLDCSESENGRKRKSRKCIFQAVRQGRVPTLRCSVAKSWKERNYVRPGDLIPVNSKGAAPLNLEASPSSGLDRSWTFSRGERKARRFCSQMARQRWKFEHGGVFFFFSKREGLPVRDFL